MVKLTMLVASLLVFVTVMQGCGTRTDQPTRNLIAHTYALACTDATVFFKHVRDNRTLFAKGGKWDSAVRRLGEELVGAGLKSIPGADIREKAYDIASSVGRPDLGPKAYEDAMNSAADMVRMGNMLQSMPAIVEGVLRGDTTAYRQSVFALSAWAIENSKTLMLPDHWVAIKKMSYQLNAWIVLQYAQHI